MTTPSAAPVREHHRMALEFLERVGSDCIGEINSEETMAAGLTYVQMKSLGLIYSTPSKNGPVWRLTAKGIQFARSLRPEDGRRG